MLRYSEEEVAKLLSLGVVKFFSLIHVLDACGLFQARSVFFQLWWSEVLLILALFVQCHITPCEISDNSISEHNHSIASCVSEHNGSIMSYPKSWDHSGRGSCGEENGDWEWQLGLQITNNTYQLAIDCITNITTTFSINSFWTKVFLMYALPSVRRFEVAYK